MSTSPTLLDPPLESAAGATSTRPAGPVLTTVLCGSFRRDLVGLRAVHRVLRQTTRSFG